MIKLIVFVVNYQYIKFINKSSEAYTKYIETDLYIRKKQNITDFLQGKYKIFNEKICLQIVNF